MVSGVVAVVWLRCQAGKSCPPLVRVRLLLLLNHLVHLVRADRSARPARSAGLIFFAYGHEGPGGQVATANVVKKNDSSPVLLF